MSPQNLLHWVISAIELRVWSCEHGGQEKHRTVAARWTQAARRGGVWRRGVPSAWPCCQSPFASLGNCLQAPPCWCEAQIEQDWAGGGMLWSSQVCRKAEERQPSVMFTMRVFSGQGGGSSLRRCCQIYQCQQQPGGSLAVVSKCESLLHHTAELFGVGGQYLSHCRWGFGYGKQAHSLSGLLSQPLLHTQRSMT